MGAIEFSRSQSQLHVSSPQEAFRETDLQHLPRTILLVWMGWGPGVSGFGRFAGVSTVHPGLRATGLSQPPLPGGRTQKAGFTEVPKQAGVGVLDLGSLGVLLPSSQPLLVCEKLRAPLRLQKVRVLASGCLSSIPGQLSTWLRDGPLRKLVSPSGSQDS